MLCCADCSYNGFDWPNTFDGCRSKKQSPILLPGSGAAAEALSKPDAMSTFSYGTLSNPRVANTGHTLQVSLPADFTSDVKIPIKGEELVSIEWWTLGLAYWALYTCIFCSSGPP
jgi:hypothetical protein